MKNKKAGWYLFTCIEVSIIEYHEDVPDGNMYSVYGPFKTFVEAKNDAIEYHRATISVARQAIRELKATKKPKR